MTMNVTFKRPSLELAMEVGSLKELAGYIQDESSELTKIFGDDMEMVVKNLGSEATGETPSVSGLPEAGEVSAKRRGRPAKDKSGPDPATATAPPPMPIPPELAKQNAAAVTNGDIPDYLKVAAPPPPPPPPVAPAAPPSGILAGKVIAAMDLRATDDVAKKSLADWLVAYQLVNAGSSYDESIAAIRLMNDEKLGAVATALAVA